MVGNDDFDDDDIDDDDDIVDDEDDDRAHQLRGGGGSPGGCERGRDGSEEHLHPAQPSCPSVEVATLQPLSAL